MSHLIAIGFKNDKFKAGGVLNELKRLNEEPAVQLNDALAVYRDSDGELRVDESYEATTQDTTARGLLWGSLIGALLAIPFTGGVSGAIAATTAVGLGTVGGGAAGALLSTLDAGWTKDGFGISENFVREVGSMLEPGDSAVFAMLYAEYPDAVVNRFEGTGGKVLVTDLSEDQKAKIEKILNSTQS